MNTHKYSNLWSYLATFSYIVMVAVNGMANILPINGQLTGEISDAYPNLFAPAGFTFAIWGVIYFLLLLYVVYQLGTRAKLSSKKQAQRDLINIFFSISSLANSLWILAWHYEIIWLSLVLMGLILGCLIVINSKIRDDDFDLKENLLAKLPFGVYLGWITVATVANVTVFLVSWGWQGAVLSESGWTALILVVAGVIGLLSTLYYRSLGYALVMLWALAGILAKHLMASQFAGAYPLVIGAVVVAALIIVAGMIYLAMLARRHRISL